MSYPELWGGTLLAWRPAQRFCLWADGDAGVGGGGGGGGSGDGKRLADCSLLV